MKGMKALDYQLAEQLLITESATGVSRNEHLWRALKHFVPRSELTLNRPVTILGVACGQAEEVIPLTSYFSSGVLGFPTVQAHFIGVEKSGSYVEYARELTNNPMSSPSSLFYLVPQATFIEGDATDLSKISGVPAKADVVFLRHPELCRKEQKEMWEKIVGQCLKHTKENGLFIITVFHETENNRLKEILKSLGVSQYQNAKNPHAIPLRGEEGFMGDKFFTVIKP